MSILRATHREISRAAQTARRCTSFDQASTGYGSGLPQSVRLVEVGPRDGLQNEPAQNAARQVPTDVKVELVDRLVGAGLRAVEVTSFVSPKWVPQLADARDVLARIAPPPPGIRFSVLAPNMKGFEAAKAAGVKEVAVFAAASETFSRRNINCTVGESLKRFEDVVAAAEASGIAVRGYVSCVVNCPYECSKMARALPPGTRCKIAQLFPQGNIAPEAAADVAGALFEMGCYEVSMGDTTGAGTPASVTAMLEATAHAVPVQHVAAHLHDTYGQAVANAVAALQVGVSTLDSSIAGLGGCPYAKGATGNVATEDLVYLLTGLGIEHGIDMDRLLDASQFISRALGRQPHSRVARAMLAKRANQAIAVAA